VADKLNPFSSSDDEKKAPTPESNATEIAAKKNTNAKEDSPGVLGSIVERNKSLRRSKTTARQAEATANNSQLIDQIDGSLKQKGIDSTTQTASLKTTPEAMSKVEEAKPPPQTADTSKLLGEIDARSEKDWQNVERKVRRHRRCMQLSKTPRSQRTIRRQDKD